MKGYVLIIEDERIMRITLEDALRGAGYEVQSFETGESGFEALKSGFFDIVVLDVRLPDVNGISLIEDIQRLSDAQVIVMTAFGTIKDAVQAMKLGAFDYITKPFSLDEFLLIVERAIEVKRLREENIRLRRDINRCYKLPNIIGESESMKRVFSLIEKVAASDITVLIMGESGTGKELVATTIHYQSRRRDGPLVKINCAAIPEGLIESELFGHEKGAFTGAMKRKPGKFELANGGTIFLDEVADLPQPAQAKLLRVLQERSFERVGGIETIHVDVRIIAATNKDLEKEVQKGRIREDLYYRLNVVPIVLPPLRERKEDIPYLIDFFVEKFNKRFSRNIRFSNAAISALMEYDYPGNIRELENIIERCIILSASEIIDKEDLPSFIKGGGDKRKPPFLLEVVNKAERDYIVKVLRETNGNKTKASQILGISRKTLWEKMKIYGIDL